jgi:hypothetical protein
MAPIEVGKVSESAFIGHERERLGSPVKHGSSSMEPCQSVVER